MISVIIKTQHPIWIPNPPRSVGERRKFGMKWQSIKTPPHPLGRHPFNIITSEIDD